MRRYTPEKIGRVISGSSRYVTARDGSSLVGFGRLLSDGVSSIFLYTNSVDSLYLRNGFQASEKRLYVRRR